MFNLQGKLKILALCICALSCNALGAQKVWKASVAEPVFTQEWLKKEYSNIVRNTITDALSQSNIVTVIDFGYTTNIIQINQEMINKARNGEMKQSELNKLGEQLACNLLIITEINDDFGFLINVKAINLVTGHILSESCVLEQEIEKTSTLIRNKCWELTTSLIKQLRNEPQPILDDAKDDDKKEELQHIKHDIERVIMDNDGVPEWNRIKVKQVVVETNELIMDKTVYKEVWQISGRIRIKLQKGKDGKDGKAVYYYQLDRIIADKKDIRRIIEGRIQLKSNTIVRELLSRLKR
jgi:hypothetical protein